MSSCTWEEFPDPLPELQKPVDLSFTTVVDQAHAPAANVPSPGTRNITDNTDFGDNQSFPVVEGHSYPIGIFLTYLNGAEVCDGSKNMRAEMTPSNTAPADWKYYDLSGNKFQPTGFPQKPVEIMAYHPWDSATKADSIPFDFTHKVNGDPAKTGPVTDPNEGRAQTNLLLCKTHAATIPSAGQSIQLGFTNVYTKVVLYIRKKEEHSDGVNNGSLTETAIENLSSNWIKNKGGIDPATGYVKSTSQAGRLWDDTPEQLDQTIEKELTFLVPAFMDANVKDDAISFILTIDGQQRLFPLKRSHLNQVNNTYGFEQNRINSYHLVYDNSILLLSLTSWSSVEANANFGEPLDDPSFILDLTGNPGIQGIFYQDTQQEPNLPDYPKDTTPNATSNTSTWKYRSDHRNNTYLSSVLLGSNGPNITDPQKLYTDTDDGEMPYKKLQVSGIDVGQKDVIWQDEYGGLIAKNVCRNYRSGGYTDWRLPRICEMKSIIIWTLGTTEHLREFLGNSKENIVKIPIGDAKKYWTATEANMGIPDQIDDQETAWYAIFYKDGFEDPDRTYRVTTMNKSEKAFIRCVRESD